MRFLIPFCTVIALAMLFAGFAAKSISNNKPANQKEVVIVDYEPITKRHLDIYFDKFPENRQMCITHKENIKRKDNDYRTKTIGNISNISSELNYEYTHDGEFLDVKLICKYKVKILYHVYIYTHMKEETQYHDGGVFRIKKYYHPESKKLTSLEFID